MRSPLLLLFCVCAASWSAEFRIGIHTLTVPDGFTVELAAGTPLVDRPITMAFDEAGALYVADSSGSNEKPDKQVKNPTHRVVRLVDKDGDGKFDDNTVFADKLAFPEGTMWFEGSLYVSAPPVIWKLTDTDSDGIAERREVWYDGKTLTGCANDLHGPYAGPDGFIYWCKGAFAEQRHRLADGREFVTRASHVFRARPDGSGLDVVMTGGMDNPVDVVFSPTGERFVCGTFFVNPGGGQRDGILHAVHGGVWGKNHGVLEGHPRTGDLMPIMTHLGPAAASGLEMPRSDALGLRGNLLCTQFNMRKVSRHVLSPDGATFSTGNSDFLVSDQTDFHPTDVVEDADGSVLIVDTGGWYKLCCPTSQLVKPDVLGAIYRVRKVDAPKADDARGVKLRWDGVAAEELSARLGDSRHEVAERAGRLLSDRGETGALASVLKRTGDARPRLLALWGLTRIANEQAREAVRSALQDKDREVRLAAATSVSLWRDRAAEQTLVTLVREDDAQLQRVAAEALGRIGDKAAISPLLDAATTRGGRFGFHALAYALYEIGDAKGLRPEADGAPGEISRTAQKMLALPKPAMAAPLPLVVPAAKPDAATVARQRARLDELAPMLKSGDAARGAEVFRSAKATCATCHAMDRQGGTLGPDLTKVGAIRTPRDLLEAIVFPSASYVRSYEPLMVETRKKEVSLGILKSETNDAIVLGTVANAELRIPRSEVVSMVESAVSVMPPGFDVMLTPQELADVVAFLSAAK
jgi:putative membrane-bound dehydrogenase-like protein